jgi:indole-3-glycerol phosphate synthase
VIAEFKRRTPSAGVLHENATIGDVVGGYEKAGAAAVSILTEGSHFLGNLGDLVVARAACELPLLRKDFIIDLYQIYETAAHGADAILLIAAVLSQEEINASLETARSLGLSAIVEASNEEDARRAIDAGAEIIGINNRNLHDFSVDLQRTISLRPLIPDGIIVVSESGISSEQDLEVLAEAGVDAVLIGEALMRADDPGAELAELTSYDRP